MNPTDEQHHKAMKLAARQNLAEKYHIAANNLARQGKLKAAQPLYWQAAAANPDIYEPQARVWLKFRQREGAEFLYIRPARNGTLTALPPGETDITNLNQAIHAYENPELAAGKWLEQHLAGTRSYQFDITCNSVGKWLTPGLLTPRTLYVILGCGLGYHVKALYDNLPDGSDILVVDDDWESSLFYFARQLPYIENVFQDQKRVNFVIADHVTALVERILVQLADRKIRNIRILDYQPVSRLEQQASKELVDKIIAAVQQQFLNIEANARCFEPLACAWSNLPYILKSQGSAGLKDCCRGYPVVIVSAGPSLNNNIEVLKQYADKVIIIASGSAIGALTQQGIVPHFLIVSDPFNRNFPEITPFLHSGTVLAASYYTMSELVEHYPGQRIFFGFKNLSLPFPFPGLEEKVPATALLDGVSSVASNAFSFAVHLGADPIIFVGQDCSFPEGVSHAAGVKAHGYDDKVQSGYEYIDGYYGGKVKTMPSFRELLRFFEGQIIQLNGKRKIINATEGGAYMHGAVHQPLAEALIPWKNSTTKVFEHIQGYCREIVPEKDELHHVLSALALYRSELTAMLGVLYRQLTPHLTVYQYEEWNRLYGDSIVFRQIAGFLEWQQLKTNCLYQEYLALAQTSEAEIIEKEFQQEYVNLCSCAIEFIYDLDKIINETMQKMR